LHGVSVGLPTAVAPAATSDMADLRTRDSKIVPRDGAAWCRTVPLSCTETSGRCAVAGVVPDRSR